MPEDVTEVIDAPEPVEQEAPVEAVADEAEAGLSILRRIGAALSFSRPDIAESADPAAKPEQTETEADVNDAVTPLLARIEALEARTAEQDAAFSEQRIAAAVDRRVAPRLARCVEVLRTASDGVTFSDGDTKVTLSRDEAADELLEALAGGVPSGSQFSARDVSAELDFSDRAAEIASKLRREHPEMSLTQAQAQADQLVLSGQEV